MAVNKTTMQRITIGAIALIMTVGTLGSFFLIIMQNNDTQKTSQTDTSTQMKTLTVDPTAYKVEGKVTELQKTDLKEGTGTAAKVGDVVRVHYKGTLAQTQQKFDSSYDRGEPADLTLDEKHVIKGWVDGIEGMKVGGKRRLLIPSALGYGSQAVPEAGIPANSDLVFEVELIAVNPPKTDSNQ